MINISSLKNDLIKGIYKSTRNSFNKEIVIESYKLIKESLNNSNVKIKHVLLTQQLYDKDKGKYNSDFYEKIIICPYHVIEKIAFSVTPQEIMAIGEIIFESFDVSNDQNYLILENISDPGNLGNIIRTSVGFNINKIFISNNSTSLYNNKTIRSSMGALFKIKVNYFSNFYEIDKLLKDKNIISIASLINESSQSIDDLKIIKEESYALILGNETKGIDSKTQKLVDKKVYIPISKNINSLNVNSAAAILIYQILRKK